MSSTPFACSSLRSPRGSRPRSRRRRDHSARGGRAIARGESTLILAPTGTGKTLTAFLWCLDRLMFSPVPSRDARCRVLYLSPLKALAVDVERNLRAPLVGISQHRQCHRRAISNAVDFDTHRRHPDLRTGEVPARAGGHSHHDARVAVPAAHVQRSRAAPLGGDRDRGRDSRAGLDQARRAHGAVTGTPGATDGAAAAAHRALGDAAQPRRNRPLPGRRRTRTAAYPEGARTTGSRSPIRCTRNSRARAVRRPVRSPSSTRASQRRWPSRWTSRSRTWPRWARRSINRAVRQHAARRCRRSGRRFTRACSRWSNRIARPCSSSTAAGSLSDWPARSTSWPESHSCAPTTDRSPGRSAPRSKTCSKRVVCAASSPPPRSNSASTWAPSISSCRSKRRPRSRAACSASGARVTA